MATSTINVKGIGPAAAGELAKHGFASAEDLASATEDTLCQVPGFGALRARRTIADAKALVKPAQPEKKPDTSKKKTKGEKKSKNKGKGKGKNKGKGKKKKDEKKGKKGKKKKSKSGKKKRKK